MPLTRPEITALSIALDKSMVPRLAPVSETPLKLVRGPTSEPLIRTKPTGNALGVPLSPREFTPARLAPVRFAPDKLRPLKDWFDKFAPERFAPGPTR